MITSLRFVGRGDYCIRLDIQNIFKVRSNLHNPSPSISQAILRHTDKTFLQLDEALVENLGICPLRFKLSMENAKQPLSRACTSSLSSRVVHSLVLWLYRCIVGKSFIHSVVTFCGSSIFVVVVFTGASCQDGGVRYRVSDFSPSYRLRFSSLEPDVDDSVSCRLGPESPPLSSSCRCCRLLGRTI